ncbi:MAG: transglutaminaseTgpA domain-containing protein [Microthrixaceae bacterium]
MSAAETTRAVRRGALIAAEAGLLILALGVITSFNRVFTGWSWWSQLAIPVAGAWAMTIAARRLRFGAVPSTVLQVVAAALVLGWVFLADHLRLGVPMAGALSEAAYQVRASFSPFTQLVAPVPPSNGFLLVIAAGMWAMVVFADVASIRFRAPVQAVLPYLAAFLALGLLARDSGRATASIVVGLSLAVFAATQRALAASELRWVDGRAAAGTRAVAATTLAVALVAVTGGALGGRLVPGGDEPVLDLRGYARRDDRRTLVSPFVSIRSLLGERSDQIMFRVEAAEPSYWRLTALDRYDETQDIWVSRGNYRPVDGELDPALDPSVQTSTLVQRFRIDGLAAGWLPAAYAPAEISSDTEVRYDGDSASLLTNDRSTADDPLEYDLRSELPDFAGAFEEIDPVAPEGLDPELSRQIELSPEVSESLGAAFRNARDVESIDIDDPVQQLLVLQDWFREEFSYDETVDFSEADDPLTEFIETRRGFCQQFSSTFALIARSLGLPSRVAVGFTPGDTESGEDGDTEYVVRGRHAHAWPEVHLSGAGWVPFEPTPQRGDPQGENHTGAEPEQAPPPVEPATSTTVHCRRRPGRDVVGAGTVDLGCGRGGSAGERASTTVPRVPGSHEQLDQDCTGRLGDGSDRCADRPPGAAPFTPRQVARPGRSGCGRVGIGPAEPRPDGTAPVDGRHTYRLRSSRGQRDRGAAASPGEARDPATLRPGRARLGRSCPGRSAGREGRRDAAGGQCHGQSQESSSGRRRRSFALDPTSLK